MGSRVKKSNKEPDYVYDNDEDYPPVSQIGATKQSKPSQEVPKKPNKNKSGNDKQNPNMESDQKTKPNQKPQVETWTCSVCQVAYEGEKSEVMECEYCEQHFCINCMSITKQQYKVLIRMSALHWFCPVCEPKATRNIRAEREVEERCSEFLKNMESRISGIESELKTKVNKEQVEEVVKEMIAEPDSRNVKDVVEQMVEEQSAERMDRESRKNNIIVFKAPETDTNLKEQRKKDDAALFLDVCNNVCECQIRESDITKAIRLGKKKEDGQPRPLLVSVENLDKKRAIMRNLHKLKDADAPHNEISMSHDMTQKEREEKKKLLEEARTRQANDTSGKWNYRVRGPPWERKIVRLKAKDQ